MGIFSSNIFDLRNYIQNTILSIGNQYNSINEIVCILILLLPMCSTPGVYVTCTACIPLDWPGRNVNVQQPHTATAHCPEQQGCGSYWKCPG